LREVRYFDEVLIPAQVSEGHPLGQPAVLLPRKLGLLDLAESRLLVLFDVVALLCVDRVNESPLIVEREHVGELDAQTKRDDEVLALLLDRLQPPEEGQNVYLHRLVIRSLHEVGVHRAQGGLEVGHNPGSVDIVDRPRTVGLLNVECVEGKFNFLRQIGRGLRIEDFRPELLVSLLARLVLAVGLLSLLLLARGLLLLLLLRLRDRLHLLILLGELLLDLRSDLQLLAGLHVLLEGLLVAVLEVRLVLQLR